MLRFAQLLQMISEAVNPFAKHAAKHGLVASPIPHAKAAPTGDDNMHHGFIDPTGTYWACKNHKHAATKLHKDLPEKAKKAKLGYDSPPGYKKVAQVCAHHKLIEYGSYDNFASIESHHVPTAAQHRTIRTAMLKSGYKTLQHTHRGEQDAVPVRSSNLPDLIGVRTKTLQKLSEAASIHAV